MKVLFLHGLDSSSETNKFEVIDTPTKYCLTVDYRSKSFEQVKELYEESIEHIKPDVIVGHSLGGFWALYMSNIHGIPCVAINPSIDPSKVLDGYPKLELEKMRPYLPRGFHIELGDEVLNMYEVKSFAETVNATIYEYDGGCHRVDNLKEINTVINHIHSYSLYGL